MTRDFKQSEAAASSQYGISWVLGGVAVGLLAGAAVYALMNQPGASSITLFEGKSQSTSSAPVQTAPQPSVLSNNASESSTPTLQDKPAEDNRPSFRYHAVLPQLEVDVPIPPPQEVAPANVQALPQVEMPDTEQRAQQQTQQRTQQQQQATTAGRYMFQLGAYRNRTQAVQMQRRAKQNGMNTRVEAAKVNGQTWYRVRLGPTNNIQVVNRWKQRLSGMGINPMMIRL